MKNFIKKRECEKIFFSLLSTDKKLNIFIQKFMKFVKYVLFLSNFEKWIVMKNTNTKILAKIYQPRNN